jgi:hypothetical protein
MISAISAAPCQTSCWTPAPARSFFRHPSPKIPFPAAATAVAARLASPYRASWRSHRLHHYRNERYWFGVTNPVADHVFGTHPDEDAVPPSRTATTLGADDA